VATKPDFLAILQMMTGQAVDYIVVGGVAAVLQGAPVATFDLDLVHCREPENLKRLLAALGSLEARYRTPGAETQMPTYSHLESPGHQLLMTRWGPLDLLGTIGKAQGYSELLDRTVTLVAGQDLSVRVLHLSTLIQLKEQLANDKDRAILPILRRTLEERGKDS
jgi:hypothetical protein